MWREGEGKPRPGGETPGFRCHFGRSTRIAAARGRKRDGTVDSQVRERVSSGLSGAETSPGRGETLGWLPRSNSIRRSNAFDRMIGNRARIFSRTFGKSEAI